MPARCRVPAPWHPAQYYRVRFSNFPFDPARKSRSGGAFGQLSASGISGLAWMGLGTGGVVLNAFELLTATYAAENFRLRDDWYGSVERKVAGAQPAMVVKKVLRGVQNTDFLQAI